MLIAIFAALFEQRKEAPNLFIIVISIIIFMFGMMRLSAKTPSKNQENDDENI